MLADAGGYPGLCDLNGPPRSETPRKIPETGVVNGRAALEAGEARLAQAAAE
jgi:hypothetical protein